MVAKTVAMGAISAFEGTVLNAGVALSGAGILYQNAKSEGQVDDTWQDAAVYGLGAIAPAILIGTASPILSIGLDTAIGIIQEITQENNTEPELPIQTQATLPIAYSTQPSYYSNYPTNYQNWNDYNDYNDYDYYNYDPNYYCEF